MRRNKIKPKSGQESVWDYPRPPRIEAINSHIKIVFDGLVIADTHKAQRVLETSHPPVYYLPPKDILMEYLESIEGATWCEWKGRAHYYTLNGKNKTAPRAAWTYQKPTREFQALQDHVAFYAHMRDVCYVNGEAVQAQPGGIRLTGAPFG